ncbi:CRISPR-associated protein, Cas5h family [Halanaerobium congolense]|jgi:CRISPR-associated protein Cas5h|uniref:CRISPR-associated Cas5h family protein n=1 Tax=Halanaerobium congolense TaxID=54121 RepID=A0A1G8M3H8_9FIRM|nr:type I-B CRISPR-associated protein Cas5b [Halanaerobium congolense]PUU90625.1 MAG: CRISPR-associated protein Cas5 [Halanaerobium sp.]TDS28939.1 CRISPR-associated Cas5h family protein [Halanaerobium congolense]SDI62433.1 CRISPR-associated protein, Cas5h family [Halanaerobium congolense]SET33713.1 CRISPR-associated protein, Cas5h family [Halanaerobium congolense]
MNKALVFDIWADYAHFKKYYTTTSPLTFSIPPKTTLYGIVSAILGFSKEEYLEYFQEGQCKIAVQIKNPVKKTRINLNLIDTKKAALMAQIETRTQIKTEFLKDAKYRIYFMHQNENLYNDLKEKLKNHKSVYSISLGLSENLANFKYIEEIELKKITENSWQKINTVIRIDKENISKGDIDFSQSNREYFSDKIAVEMKSDRTVTDYAKVLFERSGRSIKANVNQYYKDSNNNSLLFL